MTPGRDRARRAEALGRLFWAWVLTLPVVLLLVASAVFEAPWPSRLRRELAMLGLAFPVLFVVGEPLLAESREALRAGRCNADGSCVLCSRSCRNAFCSMIVR